MSARKASLPFAALVALGVITESRSARADATLDLSKLPKAETVGAPLDAKKPTRIGAGERAAGFFVGHMQQNDMTMLAPSKGAFELWTGAKQGPSDDESTVPCFATLGEQGWSDGGEQQVYLRGGGGGQSEVLAYRRTEVIPNGDEATLKEAVAWVDPVTRGARLVGSKDIPMKRLSQQYGVSVYATAGADAVHFAVIEDRSIRSRGGSTMVERPGGNVQHTACHAVTTLKLPKQGGSDLATTYVTGDMGPVQQNANNTRRGSSFELHRTRMMAVQTSASFLARDKAPVVTWSMGWIGAETQDNVEVPKEKPKS